MNRSFSLESTFSLLHATAAVPARTPAAAYAITVIQPMGEGSPIEGCQLRREMLIFRLGDGTPSAHAERSLRSRSIIRQVGDI